METNRRFILWTLKLCHVIAKKSRFQHFSVPSRQQPAGVVGRGRSSADNDRPSEIDLRVAGTTGGHQDAADLDESARILETERQSFLEALEGEGGAILLLRDFAGDPPRGRKVGKEAHRLESVCCRGGRFSGGELYLGEAGNRAPLSARAASASRRRRSSSGVPPLFAASSARPSQAGARRGLSARAAR